MQARARALVDAPSNQLNFIMAHLCSFNNMLGSICWIRTKDRDANPNIRTPLHIRCTFSYDCQSPYASLMFYHFLCCFSTHNTLLRFEHQNQHHFTIPSEFFVWAKFHWKIGFFFLSSKNDLATISFNIFMWVPCVCLCALPLDRSAFLHLFGCIFCLCCFIW